jgi:hypothetical protein
MKQCSDAQNNHAMCCSGVLVNSRSDYHTNLGENLLAISSAKQNRSLWWEIETLIELRNQPNEQKHEHA